MTHADGRRLSALVQRLEELCEEAAEIREELARAQSPVDLCGVSRILTKPTFLSNFYPSPPHSAQNN